MRTKVAIQEMSFKKTRDVSSLSFSLEVRRYLKDLIKWYFVKSSMDASICVLVSTIYDFGFSCQTQQWNISEFFFFFFGYIVFDRKKRTSYIVHTNSHKWDTKMSLSFPLYFHWVRKFMMYAVIFPYHKCRYMYYKVKGKLVTRYTVRSPRLFLCQAQLTELFALKVIRL
jgi:hypothetical protein